ncbi:hypothetical protein P3T43_003349 [Paraburkholderia sp. GAS41]
MAQEAKVQGAARFLAHCAKCSKETEHYVSTTGCAVCIKQKDIERGRAARATFANTWKHTTRHPKTVVPVRLQNDPAYVASIASQVEAKLAA